MNEENNVLTIQSLQIQPIRNMITALKDILTDVTITFTKEGLKIINFDSKTHTILVHIVLHAKNFEKYVCLPEKIIICANTQQLFKIISTITNEDILSIYIDKNDYHEGIVSELGLQFDNKDIKQCYNNKLRLIEPETEELIFPDVEYSTIINLTSSYFQKTIRDMNGISDSIEIKSVGDELIFSCVGPYATCSVRRSENTDSMSFINKPDSSVIIQGEFSLKSLSNFIKCTSLCHYLEIYLGNDLPLIVEYKVATLGYIRLCLAPLN